MADNQLNTKTNEEVAKRLGKRHEKVENIRISLKTTRIVQNITKEEEEIRQLIEETNKKSDYSEILAEKIKLRRQFAVLVADAFYYDEFKNARRALYYGVIPVFGVNYYVYKVNPFMPLRKFASGVSFFAYFSALFITFNMTLVKLEHDSSSEVGQKLRSINNGISLINPYVSPIFDEDMSKKRTEWE